MLKLQISTLGLVLLGLSSAFGQQRKEITNSIGMKLVLVNAGSFTMGSAESEEGRTDYELQHEVTISKSFYLGAYEVTQDQYEKVMGENPSQYNGPKNPVEKVSWEDSVSFCKKLSELPDEKAAGRVYRLPTEAEWEYACRAGGGGAYSFGDDVESLEEYAWFLANSERKTHIVGEKKPNRWGLYDMHGHVCEWCQDYWAKESPSGDETDPMGPKDGPLRVLRGGCWGDVARFCRTAFHNGNRPLVRLQGFGIRVAMNQPSKQLAAESAESSVVGLSTPAYFQQQKSITNSIGMKLVLIHAGAFTMGSPVSEVGRQDNETLHEVTISKSFYLGVYEVNQDEYEKVMGKNPSHFRGRRLPVEMVSWDESVSFCKKLSELPDEKAAGRKYRLPTEAEWEYACRAGSTTSYSFGDTSESLEKYAWFGGNSEFNTHQVGVKKSNRWGLFDVHGNVWEWCEDWSTDYPSGEAADPQGPREGTTHVRRGGSYFFVAKYCRAAMRDAGVPTLRSADIGFRVAMSLPTTQPAADSSK